MHRFKSLRFQNDDNLLKFRTYRGVAVAVEVQELLSGPNLFNSKHLVQGYFSEFEAKEIIKQVIMGIR
jgi:hypothetical protein